MWSMLDLSSSFYLPWTLLDLDNKIPAFYNYNLLGWASRPIATKIVFTYTVWILSPVFISTS